MGVVGRRLSLYCKRFFNPVAKLRAQLTSLVKTIEEVPTFQSHSLIYIVLILIILVQICAVYTCGGIGGEGFVEGCVEATFEGKGVCGSNVPSGGLNLCEQCRRTLLEAASQALPHRIHTHQLPNLSQPILMYGVVWCGMVTYGGIAAQGFGSDVAAACCRPQRRRRAAGTARGRDRAAPPRHSAHSLAPHFRQDSLHCTDLF
jgi:hypothetical protein